MNSCFTNRLVLALAMICLPGSVLSQSQPASQSPPVPAVAPADVTLPPSTQPAQPGNLSQKDSTQTGGTSSPYQPNGDGTPARGPVPAGSVAPTGRPGGTNGQGYGRPGTGISEGQQGPPPSHAITGQVADAATGELIEFATVAVLRAADSSLVGGGLVGEDGRFRIDKMPVGRYILKINFLGYATAYVDSVMVTQEAAEASVGRVVLTQAGRQLAAVTVEAERPIFSLGIDRKIFDVSRSGLNPSGNAVDVLANVPTVTVDQDGNVSLRNNENVTIYIDGRPSGITAANRTQVLRQIPASAIERIELITSPSARYDAEGVSGIINIILKKNKLEGLNGTLQGSIASRMKYNGSGSINYRNAKVNAYLNYNYRYNRRYAYGTARRETFNADSAFSTNQTSNLVNYEAGHFVKGGADLFLKGNNTLGAALGYAPSRNWDRELTKYNYINKDNQITSSPERYAQNESKSDNYEASLTHRKKFDDKGHEWGSDAAYADFDQRGQNAIQQTGALAATGASSFLSQPYQLNPQGNRTRTLTVQTDYVRPLKGGYKMELGAKSSTRRIGSSFSYLAGDSQPLTEVTAQRNNFDYREQVWAGYGILGRKYKKIGYQAGLRVEQSEIQSELQGSGQQYPQSYLNFFPTVNFNYAASAVHEFQASYSRRINRPGAGSLNPFTDFSDPLSLRIGNPALRPELLDAYELTWQYTAGSLSLTNTGFYRQTNQLQTRVIDVDTNSGRAIVNQINAGTRYDAGLDLVGRYQVLKGWSLTGNASIYGSRIDAPLVAQGLVRNNINYSVRLLSNATIRPGLNLQLSANYRSPFIIPQGESRPFYNVDGSISQDFAKKKATATISVSDIFNTLRFGIRAKGDNFSQQFSRKRETQVFTFTLAYRFGTSDNLSRRREGRGGERPGGGDMGF